MSPVYSILKWYFYASVKLTSLEQLENAWHDVGKNNNAAEKLQNFQLERLS